MHAGKLRTRVIIQKPSESQSASGEVTTTWATLAASWANIEPVSGRELLAADQMQATSRVRVRMRYLPGLTNECRIYWPNHTLEVNEIVDVESRGVEYELLCTEMV